MVHKFVFLTSFSLFAIFMPTNSHGFDYKTYEKKTSRSLEPIHGKESGFKTRDKSLSSSSFAKKFLEKLDSDALPTKYFENEDYSVYLKFSRISKIGVKYKF